MKVFILLRERNNEIDLFYQGVVLAKDEDKGIRKVIEQFKEEVGIFSSVKFELNQKMKKLTVKVETGPSFGTYYLEEASEFIV
jgi:hypothetical protein